MKTWQHFGSYVSELSNRLREVRHKHEEERRLLMQTRALIKSSLTCDTAAADSPAAAQVTANSAAAPFVRSDSHVAAQVTTNFPAAAQVAADSLASAQVAADSPAANARATADSPAAAGQVTAICSYC